MLCAVRCELTYDVTTTTDLILNIEAQRSGRQHILNEHFSMSPQTATAIHEMPESGNRYRRARLEPGRHVIHYDAKLELVPQLRDVSGVGAVPIADLPFDVLPHLYPSRYCPSDRLARFAWREFANLGNGHEKVQAICNWIYDNVDYLAGSSDGSTSAYDTFTLRAGVCRDFAHLGITLTRAVGIPARFVSAYAVDLVPQDFHAVFEAYLDGGWYLFDATRLCPLDGIAKIAIGRDAADSAFATYFGNLSGPPKLLEVTRLDGPRIEPQWTMT